MDPTSIQRLLEQNAQRMGQRQAALPSMLQSPDYAQDTEYKQSQAAHDQKVMELYQHDKMLADQYANPQSGNYMADPYQRELARAQQYKATGGEILDLNNQMSSRKAYLDNQSNKQLQLAQLGMQADSSEQGALSGLLSNAMKLQEYQQQQQSKTQGAQALNSFFSAVTGQPMDGSTGTGTGQPMDAQKVQQLLAGIIATNPDIAPQATQMANLLVPQNNTFEYTADNVAAGVAGHPKDTLNTMLLQNYILNQQNSKNKIDNQVVTQKGGLFGLGGSQGLINKQTGDYTPINAGGPNGNVPIASGLMDLLFPHGLFGKAPTTTAKPLASAGGRPALSSFDR